MASRALNGASFYILECADYTRRPVKLIFDEHYERIADAVAAERRIKGWSRAKKQAYIRGDFGTLAALAMRGSRRND
jgi:putative endonuclease